tara:strand:- start:18566 stop:19303 length:738 start_codon:yes stop_codon:yes gene_type:complete
MIFFPAIDLKDGKCVRLIKGDLNKSTIFDTDPVKRAQSFLEAGSKWIHVVDLNGAFEGKPINRDSVEKIVKNVDINIQLGGGIRDIDTIDFWINLGIRRIVLGTVALKNSKIVELACKKHPNKIAVSIDTRNGMVAVEGWEEQSQIKALDLVKNYENIGLSAIIYTDINRDGVLLGPAIKETINFAKNINIPVIVSGGVSSKEDLIKIKEYENVGISGVISGRAIYDHRLDLKECNALMEKNVKN